MEVFGHRHSKGSQQDSGKPRCQGKDLEDRPAALLRYFVHEGVFVLFLTVLSADLFGASKDVKPLLF